MPDEHDRDGSEETNRALLEETRKFVKMIMFDLERARIGDFMQLLFNPWRLLWANFLSGLARGVGFVLGFTIFAAFLLTIMRDLGQLNIPIIGKFIADIVEIVNRQLEGRRIY